MSDKLTLTKSEELKTSTDEHSSSLIGEAWQAFKSQPSVAIVAELAAGTALVAYAARGLFNQGAKTALRVAEAQEMKMGVVNLERDVMLRTEAGFDRAAVGSLDVGAGSLPGNTKDLRAALEQLGQKTRTAGEATAAKTFGGAGGGPLAKLEMRPIFTSADDLRPQVAARDFGHIEEAMRGIRRGFPRNIE